MSFPSGAIPVNNSDSSVISQSTLLGIAAAAAAAITTQTGVEVNNVGRYTAPTAVHDSSTRSGSSLALVLCLTLIPAAIIISVGAAFG